MDSLGFYNSDFDDREIYGDMRSECDGEEDFDTFWGKKDEESETNTFYDLEMIQDIVRKTFENQPNHGKSAHAYSHNIDNFQIIQMWNSGKSFREIANHFNCSPSTIRNRLVKMGFIRPHRTKE